MNLIEKHGNKIAAALCVASFIPAAYTIFAQENDESFFVPGQSEPAVASVAEEIKPQAYYIQSQKESGTIEEAAHKAASAEETAEENDDTIRVSLPSDVIAENTASPAPDQNVIAKAPAAVQADYHTTLPTVTASAEAKDEVQNEVKNKVQDVQMPVQKSAEQDTVPAETVDTRTDNNLTAAVVKDIPADTTENTVAEEAPAPFTLTQLNTLPADSQSAESAQTVTSESQPDLSEEPSAPAKEYVSNTTPDLDSSSAVAKPAVDEKVEAEESEEASQMAPADQEEAADPVLSEPVEGTIYALPVQDPEEKPAEEQNPAEPEVPAEEQKPVQDTADQENDPAEDNPVVEEPTFNTPAVSEEKETESVDMPEQSQPSADAEQSASTSALDSLNQKIAQAALGLVGTTNGYQCTEVATMALQQAGVDADVMWPEEYYALGEVTSDPQAGNLIIYPDAGLGTSHIAIYIGDGQAVHGNFHTAEGESITCIAPADLGDSNHQYVQVMPQ